MRALALVVLLVGCAVNDVELEADAAPELDDAPADDAREGLPDDGFGFRCNANAGPNALVTHCYASSGLRGICDAAPQPYGAASGICRRACPGVWPAHGCPAGQWAELVAGVDENGHDNCVCMPKVCDVYGSRGGALSYANCYAADLEP